jgi:protein TonB
MACTSPLQTRYRPASRNPVAPMYASRPPRLIAALAAFGMLLLIGAVLTIGLRVSLLPFDRVSLTSIDLAPPPPKRVEPTPPQPRRANAPAARDDASPRNLRNRATPVFGPSVIPLVLPPPIVAATQPAAGQAASSGASSIAGPGQGAGGMGNGLGGGGDGGDGDGGFAVVGPRQIRGRLSFADLPEGTLQPGSRASVGVRYTVSIDGRVSACRAERPSGFAAIDALTCRLIVERFRFRPARDARRRPISAVIVETHSWFIREEEAKGAD